MKIQNKRNEFRCKVIDEETGDVFRVGVHFQNGRRDGNWRRENAVIYVHDPGPEKLGQMDVPPFGSTRGDDSEEDKLWRKYNRLEVANKRRWLNEVLILGLKSLGHDQLEPLDPPKFNRKAGCSCGCSPGFTCKGLGVIDVWISVELIQSPRQKAKEMESAVA